jgi:hypothetical protein
MSALMLHAKIRLGTIIVATVIIYGSLYPFEFRVPPHDIGPVVTFLASIREQQAAKPQTELAARVESFEWNR